MNSGNHDSFDLALVFIRRHENRLVGCAHGPGTAVVIESLIFLSASLRLVMRTKTSRIRLRTTPPYTVASPAAPEEAGQILLVMPLPAFAS
jgi:hypothetical protein